MTFFLRHVAQGSTVVSNQGPETVERGISQRDRYIPTSVDQDKFFPLAVNSKTEPADSGLEMWGQRPPQAVNSRGVKELWSG